MMLCSTYDTTFDESLSHGKFKSVRRFGSATLRALSALFLEYKKEIGELDIQPATVDWGLSLGECC